MSVTRDGIVYNVDPAVMDDSVKQTYATAEDVQAHLSELKNYVIGLEDAWRGIAAARFQELMQDWDANAQKLHQALVAIGDGLGGTSDNYQRAEHAAQANVSRIALPPARLN
ncbi:WXG100 family type VII secretion target [Streptomyces sp. SID11233]|nr:WXG100 family type VII secretion target [Streptomyces sp. SID11233]